MSRQRFLFFKTSLAPQIHELSKLGEKVTTGGRCVKKTSMQVRLSFLKLKFPSWLLILLSTGDAKDSGRVTGFVQRHSCLTEKLVEALIFIFVRLIPIASVITL